MERMEGFAMTSPRLIEFAGLPGAGKTTIARDVVAGLRQTGYHCFVNGNLDSPVPLANTDSSRLLSKVQTMHRLLASGSRHRRVAYHALRYAAGTEPRNLNRFGRVAHLLIWLEQTKAVLDDDFEFVIFDQGLIQSVWSIGVMGESPSDKDLMDLLASLMQEVSPAVIYVNIDALEATDRVHKRSSMSSRFDRMSASETERILTRHNDFFERILGWCDEFQTFRHMTVDGSQPVLQNVRQVRDFIEAVPIREQIKQEGA